MAISRITSDQFAQQLREAILSRNVEYDTQIGPIPDLFIWPASGVLELQNERIRAVQQLLSLTDDGSFSDEDLDRFVANEQMIRLSGSKATVSLIFSRSTVPTSNITIRANFPVATLADETTGQAYTFLTLQDATLVAANAASYFNNTTQRYELSIPAEAILGAAGANVGANRVTRPLRPLVGFDSVFNRDEASGGGDVESNTALINRYYLSLMGTGPSTTRGISKILRNIYNSVLDSSIICGNNPLNVRSATDGGAVDVYIIGGTPTTTTESIVFPGVEQIIPLSHQPVNAILSAGTYIQGTDFVLVKDTGGYAGSESASDGIRWLSTGTFPAIGSVVVVTYTYNSLLGTLQAAFLDDDKAVPGRDILFKTGTQVPITLTGSIKIKPGFSVTSVISAVTSAIMNLINVNKLDADVEVSDIHGVVRSFSSVDNFIIQNLSRVGQMGTSDVAIAGNEYATLLSSDIILNII